MPEPSLWGHYRQAASFKQVPILLEGKRLSLGGTLSDQREGVRDACDGAVGSHGRKPRSHVTAFSHCLVGGR